MNLVILKSLLPASVGLTLTALTHNYFPQPLQLSVTTGEFATVGRFDLNWEDQQYKCWISQIITFALLAVLQAVNMFWFFLICRILWRIVFTRVVKDERSEDEDEEEEEVLEKVGPAAGEVGMNGYANGHAISPPGIAVNGKPVGMNGMASSGMESRGKEDVTRRKR